MKKEKESVADLWPGQSVALLKPAIAAPPPDTTPPTATFVDAPPAVTAASTEPQTFQIEFLDPGVQVFAFTFG